MFEVHYRTGQASVDPESLDMARQMALRDRDGLSCVVQPLFSVCGFTNGDNLALITSEDGGLSILPNTPAALEVRETGEP